MNNSIKIKKYTAKETRFSSFSGDEIRIESVKLAATTRKLKVRWSAEPASDLLSIHGLDMEKELMQMICVPGSV